MGLDVELQDESGVRIDSVADPTNLLARLLQAADQRTHPMLASIDPYGDTVFNTIQIQRFLSEWVDVAARTQCPEECELVSRIQTLAHRCRNEAHLYLKFYGD